MSTIAPSEPTMTAASARRAISMRPSVPTARKICSSLPRPVIRAVASAKEPIRIERAPPAPLQLDDLAAVQTLLELHPYDLEQLRHPAADRLAAAHFDDFGDVPAHDICAAALRDRRASRDEQHDEDEQDAHAQRTSIVVPSRSFAPPTMKSSARLNVAAGIAKPSSRLPSHVTVVCARAPGATSSVWRSPGRRCRTVCSPTRPDSSTMPESGPMTCSEPLLISRSNITGPPTVYRCLTVKRISPPPATLYGTTTDAFGSAEGAAGPRGGAQARTRIASSRTLRSDAAVTRGETAWRAIRR